MGKPTDKAVRVQLIFGAVLLMLIALFTSRVLLSAGFIAFLLLSCVHGDAGEQLLRFFRTPMLVGLSCLFFIPLVSGWWSEDGDQWLRSVRIKLPLLLFPLAFAGAWQFSRRQWTIVAGAFLLLVTGGCIWSLWQYAQNMQQINNGYLKAKAMPTPLADDHIRFSLLVCIGILTAAFVFIRQKIASIRIAVSIVALLFFIYLHLLSARTGLLATYAVLLAAFIYLILKFRKRKITMALLAALVLMPLIAWNIFPTFQNRIKYMIYDFSFIRNDKFLVGSNDGSRTASLRAGWEIMKENPGGVGSGDVVNETVRWYEANIPQMASTRLYPSSEWLMYGCSAGWIGFLLFTLIICLPFFVHTSFPFFWMAINGVLAFSLLFDIGLEVQFGVFIYGFVLLWWWKWLKQEGDLIKL